jgi:DNA-binding NarL/FixJ family response regulator
MDGMPAPTPGPVEPLRVIIIDADDRVRESLTGLLGIGPRVVVVGSAGRPDDAIALARDTAPDVVIIDPRLPEMATGLELIGRLRAATPDIRVLAMGWGDGPEPSAVAAGADGWVRKTFRPTDLVAAICGCVEGPAEARSGAVL